ncbi:terminal uridylyltransferase 4 isoform X1 [Hydra vulgaris]|uniref:terminal uridylyltransferase 4 isoform X1 n=1 Tax=Hydra vulgaris TaxID=6087 RepID=UPI001F5FC5D6|nr:terminal uridylyltransferase 4 [Hydra vulgaris]
MDIIQKWEEMNEIYCFNKKSDKNNYDIFCFLCKKQVTGQNEILKHCRTGTHKAESERIMRKKKRHFEAMNNKYEFQLNNILEQQLLTTQYLTKEDLNLREEVCKRFEECLKKMIAPDLHCRLYGSSLTLLGFKDSNVDIDIKFDMQKMIEFNPLISDPLCFFSFVVEVIQKQKSLYSDLEDNLNMKNPNIKFKEIKSGLSCCIAPFYSKCYQTSDLIIKYTNADKRCAKLAMLIRMWSKVCGLDNADNGGLSPYCFVLMVINYLQHTEPPVLPIIKVTGCEHEVNKLVDQENEDMYSIPNDEVQCWSSKNNASIAVLFIGFLHYFLVTFHHQTKIVNIRQHAPLLRSLRRYGSRRLVIEDPFISNQNVGKSLGSQLVMNFLTKCMEITYKYCISFKNRVESHFMKENTELKENDGENKLDNGHHDLEEKLDEEQVIHFAVNKVLKELLNNVAKEISCIASFHFRTTSFSPKTPFPKFCSSCKSDGHGHTTCEVENFIVKPLQPLNKANIDILDQVCVEVMTTCEMTGTEFDFRLKILKKTENHFKKIFDDSCRLSLFGSSVNGFGFRNSDLDLCLRFETDTPPKDLNYQRTIGLIENALKKSSDFSKVFSIKSAKVPIVKFCLRNGDIDGDISLYNCLAIVNSKLLKTYAMIDTRVRIMGYCIKYFAKICNIGDASRGSLSSYAYILLMLYYLQHCEPPVVPVLQELAVDKRKTVLIDGKDTWFFDDIQNLDNVWKDYGKNKQSIAELWIGFFNFYVEKFSFKRSVIAIRQKNSISKFQKSWLRYSVAIEDPFDLDHNLGAGITDNMYKYIISCFKKARLHFGSPLSNSTKLSMKEYYFDRSCFTDDIVPNDRCCRICGKIGHVATNCREVSDSDENGEQKSPTKDMGLRCHKCNQRGHRKQDCTFQDRRQRQDSDSRNQKWRDHQTNGQEKPIANETKMQRLLPKKREDILIKENDNRANGTKKQPKGLNEEMFQGLSPVKQISSAYSNFLGKQSSVQHVLPQQLHYNVSNFLFNSYGVSKTPPNLPPPPQNLSNHQLKSFPYIDPSSIEQFKQLNLNEVKQISHHQPQSTNELERKNLFPLSPLNVGISQAYLPNNMNSSTKESYLHSQPSLEVRRDQSADKKKKDQSADKKRRDQSADKKKTVRSANGKRDQSAEKTNERERVIENRRVVAKNDAVIQSDIRDAGNTKSVSNRNDASLGFSNTKSLTNQSNNGRDISNRNQNNVKGDVSNRNPAGRDISNRNQNNVKGDVSNRNSPGNQIYVNKDVSNTKSSNNRHGPRSDIFMSPIDYRFEELFTNNPNNLSINQTPSGIPPASRNNRGKRKK